MITIGTQVIADDIGAGRVGEVIGAGWFVRNGKMEPCFLVGLGSGFYAPGGGYISMIAVHPDNVQEIV